MDFKDLMKRHGNYSLPYLIKIYDEKSNYTEYLCNNNDDINYEGTVYKASSFTYKPESEEHGFDGGGTLEITTKDNDLTTMVRKYNHIILDVVGAIDGSGEITPIKLYHHEYGNVTVTKTKISFTYEKDDRLDMTFPTLIWTRQNNRGNS